MERCQPQEQKGFSQWSHTPHCVGCKFQFVTCHVCECVEFITHICASAFGSSLLVRVLGTHISSLLVTVLGMHLSSLLVIVLGTHPSSLLVRMLGTHLSSLLERVLGTTLGSVQCGEDP